MAAANLGSLVATVAANTKPFQSGMKRANGMLSQLGQKLGITDRQLKTMAKTAAAAAAAFFAFKKVGAMLQETAQRIDDLAKRARALGAEVNQVAQLTFASALAGGDEQRFFSTMGRLMLNLGQASATTKTALSTLGLSVEELANMSPIDAFLALQDALAGVENQAERMGIIALIAGGRMENMIPLMNLLGTDVNAAMAEFSELHGVIKTKPWEDYVDALTRLETAWFGLKMTMLQDLLPAFEAIVNSFKEVLRIVRLLWPLIRNLALALAATALAWWGITAAQKAWTVLSTISAKALKNMVILLIEKGKALASASLTWWQFAKVVAASVAIMAAVGAAMAEMQEVAEELENLGNPEEDKGGWANLLENARKLEELAKKANALLSELRTPEEVFRDTLEELAAINVAFEQLGLTADEAAIIWNRGVAKALATLLQSKKVMDSMRQAGALKLGTMAEASGRMAAERQQQRQTEYLANLNAAMATANDILADIRDTIQPPPGNVPALD